MGKGKDKVQLSLVEEARNIVANGGLDQSSTWDRVRVNGSVYTVERAKTVLTKFALDAINISYVYESSASKDFCALCRCYYERASLVNRVPNHRIIDLQKEWNYTRQGRRYNSASFLYSSSKVCIFCTQLFSDVPLHIDLAVVETCGSVNNSLSEASSWSDAIEKKLQQKMASSSASIGSMFSEVSDAVSEMNLNADKTRDSPIKATAPLCRNNIALYQKTYQSSVVDGYSPSNAIEEMTLLLQSNPLGASSVVNSKSKVKVTSSIVKDEDMVYTKKMFCKTRREVDPWWEIDWGLPQNVHSISFKIGKKNPTNLLDITVLLLRAPTGFEDPFIDSVYRKAIATKQFFTTQAEDSPLVELFEWTLPADVRPVAIRVQLRGISTLKIAQFIALQGDGVINSAFTESDLQRYAGSFATIAPKAMKEGFAEIRSQLRNKKKVQRAATKVVAHFDPSRIISNVKEVEEAIRHKREQIAEWLAKVRGCIDAAEGVSFSGAELRVLYTLVFLDALQTSEDRRYDEYLLDESELFDAGLLEGYPRCDLMEIFLKLRGLLIRIQHKTQVKALGPLMDNHRLCKLADDPSEWLQALKMQLEAVNSHWDRFYKKPQKPTIVNEDKRGCSWSQFIIIITYAVFRGARDIPSAAFGISSTPSSTSTAATELGNSLSITMGSEKSGSIVESPHVLRKATADPRVPKKSFAFAKYKLDRFSKRVLAEPSFPDHLDATFTDLGEYASRHLTEDTDAMRSPSLSRVNTTGSPNRVGSAAKLATSPSLSGAAGSRVSSPMHNTHALSASVPMQQQQQSSVFDSGFGGAHEEAQEIHRVCGLCALKFAKSGVDNKVMKKHLINLRLRWGIKNISSAGEEIDSLEQSISLYNLINVCNFCAQFFHPDSPDGISLPPSEQYVPKKERSVYASIQSKKQSQRDLIPFYDYRYQIPENSWRKLVVDAKAEAQKALEALHHFDGDTAP